MLLAQHARHVTERAREMPELEGWDSRMVSFHHLTL